MSYCYISFSSLYYENFESVIYQRVFVATDFLLAILVGQDIPQYAIQQPNNCKLA